MVIFADGQPEGWVDAEKIGVIAIFVTGSYLLNSLTHHLDQGMSRMIRRPQVFQTIL
jgi:hypothetical protein